MILIISPSKTQDFSPASLSTSTTPSQIEQTATLSKHLKKLNAEQLKNLLKVSTKLSDASWQKFQDFHLPFNDKNATQALLAFKGDVYRGIKTEEYSDDDFQFAQEHLRIISGFYGILKPLDLIQPYRLEMSTALATDRGNNLYQFWGDILTTDINKNLAAQTDLVLINLASVEYFKALNPRQIKGRVIDIAFKENKNGIYKTIAIHAKRARGKMVNFVIKNRLQQISDLTHFTEDDYRFSEDYSSPSTITFHRG